MPQEKTRIVRELDIPDVVRRFVEGSGENQIQICFRISPDLLFVHAMGRDELCGGNFVTYKGDECYALDFTAHENNGFACDVMDDYCHHTMKIEALLQFKGSFEDAQQAAASAASAKKSPRASRRQRLVD